METAVGAAACPVSQLKVSATAARINGMIVTALLAVALLVPAPWVLAILVVDFSIKVFAGFRVSPICALSRALAGGLHLPTRPVDQAPKRFAAELGLVFSSVGLVLGLAFDLPVAYTVVVGTFAVCAALEGFAGFCVGCVVYTYLPTWARKRPTARFDRG
jgi:hypothetical protein